MEHKYIEIHVESLTNDWDLRIGINTTVGGFKKMFHGDLGCKANELAVYYGFSRNELHDSVYIDDYPFGSEYKNCLWIDKRRDMRRKRGLLF